MLESVDVVISNEELLKFYDLELIGTDEADGHLIYTIEAVPLDDAPVVWGKEEIVLRDDYVLLSQTFFDQSLIPLKRMETRDVFGKIILRVA